MYPTAVILGDLKSLENKWHLLMICFDLFRMSVSSHSTSGVQCPSVNLGNVSHPWKPRCPVYCVTNGEVLNPTLFTFASGVPSKVVKRGHRVVAPLASLSFSLCWNETHDPLECNNSANCQCKKENTDNRQIKHTGNDAKDGKKK